MDKFETVWKKIDAVLFQFLRHICALILGALVAVVFFIISSTLSSSSSVTARQPRPTRVSKRSLSIIISSASPCALPSRTAHFVPPMSIPIIYFFILYQITSDFTAHILYT